MDMTAGHRLEKLIQCSPEHVKELLDVGLYSFCDSAMLGDFMKKVSR